MMKERKLVFNGALRDQAVQTRTNRHTTLLAVEKDSGCCCVTDGWRLFKVYKLLPAEKLFQSSEGFYIAGAL